MKGQAGPMVSGAARIFSPGRGKRIAVFASFSGKGGVERMIVNLCEGLVAFGCPVDLVLVKAQSEHLQGLSPEVNVIKLKTSHTFGSVFALASYLRRARPQALLAAKDRAGKVAVLARRVSGVDTRVVFRIGTTLSAALEGKSGLRKGLWYLPMRWLYPLADAIVAVSKGVAEDLSRITGLPMERFQVIPNPVITPRLAEMARAEVDHPWFSESGVPVVMGIGRLTRQKDFPTLIRAFSRVREQVPCRLIILGEGQDREKLETLAARMGVKEEVDLPGFASNPYAWLNRASLFVLSSAWEGSPNALTEALALGVPVVATDCPSGPREILEGGKVGPLVPVGDAELMAEAIKKILSFPPERDFLKRAAETFTMENSCRRYFELLLGSGTEEQVEPSC
jgi:glycosyltransferase involved in cell wall biosynthesis